MKEIPKTEGRRPKAGGQEQKADWQSRNSADGRLLVTRLGLAAVLGVSLRTVDRMLAAGEIAPVRVGPWAVRFDVQDVLERLRKGGRRGDVISDQSSVTNPSGSAKRPNPEP